LTRIPLSEITDEDQFSDHQPGDCLPNISEKSVIFAPFNTTLASSESCEIRASLVDPTQKLVFGAKTRDANRQYEFNNNG